jgi:hypothetical protein
MNHVKQTEKDWLLTVEAVRALIFEELNSVNKLIFVMVKSFLCGTD